MSKLGLIAVAYVDQDAPYVDVRWADVDTCTKLPHGTPLYAHDVVMHRIAKLETALRYYAYGAPCCESDEERGGIRTSGCKHQNCEFPECAKPQFPVWDKGQTARTALEDNNKS